MPDTSTITALRRLAQEQGDHQSPGFSDDEAYEILMGIASNPNVENKNYLPYVQRQIAQSKKRGDYSATVQRLLSDALMAD